MKAPLSVIRFRDGAIPAACSRARERAFTLAELVAVLAVIVLLGSLRWVARANATGQSRVAYCFDNQRQLTLAWLMYAAENGDRLAGNLDGGDAQSQSNTNRNWCVGWLDFSGGSANTNVSLLTRGQMGRYTRTPRVYKCPEDTSLSRGRTGFPRVRSVSMNGYIGERAGPFSSGYRQFRRLSEIVDPAPAKAFVFIDEREDSINDPLFQISMDSYSPLRPSAYAIVDYPADWHNRGTTLSFADGHVELWRWRDERTMPLHRPGVLMPLNIPSPNNPDVARIQESTSRKISP